MGDGDDRQMQCERIEMIVTDLAANAKVVFDAGGPGIQFKIVEQPSGTVIMPRSGRWEPKETAARSDDWIRRAIGALSGGKIGIRTFQTGEGYRARYGEYDLTVEARDDGWYWRVENLTNPSVPQLFDSPQREVEAEEAKRAAALALGTLTGEMALTNDVTLGEMYQKIHWVKI